MSNILVTGAAGFIGTNLCQKLLSQKHSVIGIDNFITGSETNITRLAKNPNFQFFNHDITKPFPKNLELRLPAKALATVGTLNLELIYHLACPTGVENLQKLGREMLLTCSTGTLNILEIAQKAGAKLLFTSSSEVYGNPQVFPQDETYTGNVDQTGVRSTYEEGKRFAESLISFYVREKNLDAKIVRVFNTYGPAMSTEDSRVIPRFLKQALAQKPLPLHGQGEQKRTFCYVDDLVAGLILIMQKGLKGQVYNLGGEKQVKIKDLAVQVLKITGSKSPIKTVDRPPHDHQGRQPALSKVKKLGWRQKVTLSQGLTKTLSYLKSL